MKIYILVNEMDKFPKKKQIKKVMWEEAEHISVALGVKKFGIMTMTWDKWLDDERWKGNEKSCEYINFELKNKSILEIEVNDEALFVDKRALHRASIFISKKTNSLLGYSPDELVKVEEFQQKIKEYTHISFDEAVEESYLEVTHL